MAEHFIAGLMNHNYCSNIHVDAQLFDAGRGREGEKCCEQMKPRLERLQIVYCRVVTYRSITTTAFSLSSPGVSHIAVLFLSE